jgi:tagatose 6-phosphate kinase
MTEFYEKGYPIPPERVTEMLDLFRRIVSDYEAVTLSGSLPPGVPLDFYAQLIRLAHESAVPVLLDSSGEALRHGVAAGPTLIKPNETEVAILSERPLSTVTEFSDAAGEIARRYNTTVMLSMGSEGAIVADNHQAFHVRNPQVKAVSAVGSGDCMLAGLAYGLAAARPLIEAAKIGIAAGTANTLAIGAGQFMTSDFEALLSSTEINQL